MTPSTDSPAYDLLNNAWKATCRIVLKDEAGELEEYGAWLEGYMPPLAKKKSCVSGKDVIMANARYCDRAAFISMDEADGRKIGALSINDIKDIDSIARAVSEVWRYTGNKVQGNSSKVDSSDIVVDSTCVYGSSDISSSEYVCSSFMVRKGSRYVFGSGWCGQTEFAIRHVGGFNNTRVLESSIVIDSSDAYYCDNVMGCHDVMFSFSQRNARHCIGNNRLQGDKYYELKAKLLSELREEMKTKKRLPSLGEMAGHAGRHGTLTIRLGARDEKTSMEPMEKAFASLCRVMFGKEMPMGRYESWLLGRMPAMGKATSPFGRATSVPDDPAFPAFSGLPKGRLVTFDEALELGKLRLEEGALCSIERIREGLPEIAYFSSELVEGNTNNIVKSPHVVHSSNIYNVYSATHSEYAGLGWLVLNSRYAFGCYRVMESEFCLKCHNSFRLNRCFEMDSSSGCLDSMFCHNSEGLSDCMFCFNVKGMRNAIGNAELERDRYKSVRNLLVEQMAQELGSKGMLELDIYNVGCRRFS